MKRWIERALNIHSGDLGRGTLLCSCLFLIITTYKIGGVAGAALFLSRFQAKQLAYADIASALVVALVVAGYVVVSRRVPLLGLLLFSTVFFASNCALFWALAHYHFHLSFLFPVFYVWVKIFGVLVPTQIWTLANYVLTTREAKRVFGMVGGGGIAGWIFSGYFSKAVAKNLGTETLLLGMALFLLICTGLIILIWRSGRIAIGGAHAVTAGSDSPRNLFGSMRIVFSSSYLRAIAAVICISSLVTTLTGWQFLAIAQERLVKKDVLAAFFGDFNFYAGVLSLLFQLLLTSRFLRRFGIGTALFVLPTTVFLGSAGLLIFGTLGAAVVLKGCDQTLRYSLDKSTAELLYLPLPARIKLQVKWFIDTVIWRMGDGLSGLAVLIFATTLHLPARQISWIVLALGGCWLAAVSVARRQYVASLKESISQHRVDVEQASTAVLDRSTADLLASKLSASDPNDILYALSLFEVERQRAAHPVVRSLLSHPAAAVRQKAIVILAASGDKDKTLRPDIEKLLRDPDLNVRTEALLYLTHHAHVDPLELIQEVGDFADFSVRSALVAFLARPGDAQNIEAAQQILAAMVNEQGTESQRTRVEAARVLGVLPDCFDPLLGTLLADADAAVAREAIRSVGKLRKRRLVPDLLDRLGHRELGSDAVKALGELGDTIVGALRDHLGDSSIAIEARREIPAVLLNVGTPAAARVLMENLLESDTTLRFRIISALNKLHHLHPEVETDTQMLETVLAAEILGHYRSYQILDKLGGNAGNGEDPVTRALTESMQQELERIFRLLGLLYPHLDVHSAYLGLQSKNVSVYDNALEFLDNVLKSQLREMLVPLLDGKVTVAERARLAQRLVRAKIDNQEQAVTALVQSDDPWLRSCGAYAIGSFGLKSLEGELNRCLNDSDPLLRETARTAKLRLETWAANA
jgi:ATP:ADP antiporter, AAA family